MLRENPGNKQESVFVQMKQRETRSKAEGPDFDGILSEYKDRVFALCFRVLGDYDDADDCAQEAFVKIYHAFGSFRGDSKLSTWIYRIAYNTALDAARSRSRKRKRFLFLSGSEGGFELPDKRENPENEILRGEKGGAIQNALLRLPVDQRSAVVLCDVEGRSYTEISEITGSSVGTVKSRIARGREKLRELLRGEL